MLIILVLIFRLNYQKSSINTYGQPQQVASLIISPFEMSDMIIIMHKNQMYSIYSN